MKYYALYDNHNILIGINTDLGGEEITHDEYNRLLTEIKVKASHVDAVYADPLAIDKVPAEWRDEIFRRVEERKQAEQEAQNVDISLEELGTMMEAIL